MSSPAGVDGAPCPSCGLSKCLSYGGPRWAVDHLGEHATIEALGAKPGCSECLRAWAMVHCSEWEESEKQFLRPINPDPATAMAQSLRIKPVARRGTLEP